MIAIERHLVVLGCGLVATAMLAYGGGFATAAWLGQSPGLCEPLSPPTGEAGDAAQTATQPASSGEAVVTTVAGKQDGNRPAPAPGARAPIAGAAFHIQVGSFLDQEAAGVVANHLADHGYQASIETRTDRTGVGWYVPVIGAYNERAIAVEAAREVARRAGVDAHVVALAKDNAP